MSTRLLKKEEALVARVRIASTCLQIAELRFAAVVRQYPCFSQFLIRSRKVGKPGTGASIDSNWEQSVGASGRVPRPTSGRFSGPHQCAFAALMNAIRASGDVELAGCLFEAPHLNDSFFASNEVTLAPLLEKRNRAMEHRSANLRTLVSLGSGRVSR